MNFINIPSEKIKFKAARASGPGGQRTNRRSTKVELWIAVGDLLITDAEKKMAREKLAHHINHNDEIWVTEEEERSQEMNRDKALARLNEMIENAIRIPAPRIPTEPPRYAKEKRIREKKIVSRKKEERRTI